MSFRMIRQSKFRHVFGKPLKKEQCYDNIRITKISGDSTFCSVNPKYVAIITEAAGGGSFLVHSLDKTGRVDRDTPKVVGHKATVLDIKWCPHDDDVIASGSEDCTVKIWQIPDGGLYRNLEEPIADLHGHQRRVGFIEWHPSAEDVILSCSADQTVIVWNVKYQSPIVSIEFPEAPITASWNFDGSRFVVSCKDHFVRIIDARSGSTLQEKVMHEGSKPTHVVYLKNGKIFSTGFSKRSERQIALWNESLENIMMDDIDNSSGVLFPFYDPDTSVVYLCGKGDGMIKYYEINEEAPYLHYLNIYQSSEPQRGIGWMPKRGLDIMSNEIARFYKLHTKGLCEVIPMKVPRKSELFQEDLYPDTAGDQAALTVDEWISGKNSAPVMISLKERSEQLRQGVKPVRNHVLASRVASYQTTTASTPQSFKTPLHVTQSLATQPQHTPEPTPITTGIKGTPMIVDNKNTSVNNHQTHEIENIKDLASLMDDVRKLKIIAKGHERRIKELEEKLARCQIEDENEDEDEEEEEEEEEHGHNNSTEEVRSNGISERHHDDERSTVI